MRSGALTAVDCTFTNGAKSLASTLRQLIIKPSLDPSFVNNNNVHDNDGAGIVIPESEWSRFGQGREGEWQAAVREAEGAGRYQFR